MPGSSTWPYNNDDADLMITHEDGEDTVQDQISTFPDIDGGDGQPKTITVRKQRP